MPRVKRGTTHTKRRKKILSRTKGMKWGRKSKVKLAKTAGVKAGAYAYRDRRAKKRTARAAQQIRINAAARDNDISYSKLMGDLKKRKVDLDRKILSELAEAHPEVFKKLVKA